MQDAGVGQECDTRGLGGIDHGAVLGGAVTQFVGGDQQQFIDTFERGGQCSRLVVVGCAHNHTLCGEVLDFAGVSDQGDDLLGWHAFKQGLDNETAQLAGGSGDGDRDKYLDGERTKSHPRDQSNFL